MAQPNPWDNDPVVGQQTAAQPQQQRGVRLVVPAAPVATPQTVEQRNSTVAGTNQTIEETNRLGVPQGYTRQSDGSVRPMPGAPAGDGMIWDATGTRAIPIPGSTQEAEMRQRQTAMENARTSALDQIRLTIQAAQRARGRSQNGYFATGFGSDIMSSFGGTEARNLRGDLETIGGNIAFRELQKMREASPTGGALGNVTERELSLLQSTIASLDPEAGDEEFQRRMDDIIRTYGGLYTRLGGDMSALQADDRTLSILSPSGRGNSDGGTGSGGQPGIADQSNAPGSGPDAGRGGDASVPALDASWQARPLMEVAGALNYDNFYELTEERGRVVMRPKVWGADEAQPMFFLQRSPNGRTYMRNADTGEESEITAPDISQYRSEDGGIGQGLDAFVRGAADTASFGFSDELSAAVGPDSYNDNLALSRAIDRYDAENGWSRLGGQLVGGVALSPLARAGSVGQAARQGAAMGAGYGFGSANGDIGDRLPDAAVGAAIGGGVGAGAQRLLGTRGPASSNANQVARRQEIVDVGTAARAEELPVSRPIVDPAARDRAARVDAAFGNSGAVRTGYQGTADAIADRASGLGERGASTQGGQAVERGALGQRFRDSFDRWRQTSRQYTTDLYDDASRLAGNPTFEATNMAQSLRQSISELSSDGAQQNAAEIAFLQRYLDDLIDPSTGQLRPRTIQNVRNTRTNLRGSVSEAGLQASQAEARVLRALDAAGDDIEAGIRAGNASRPGQGEAAIRAYRNADAVYRLRAETISDAKRLVLGNANSPEQIVSNVQRLMGQGRGDSGRLATFLRTLQPEDRADFAATIAGSLGRKSPDAPFMLGQFMTHTSQMSDDAIRTVFGAEGLASLRNLRTVTQALQRAQGRLNSSNTARVSSWGNARNQAIAAALGVGAGAPVFGGVTLGTGGIAGLAVAGGLLAARTGAVRLSERALMNPNITRFVRRASTADSPRQMRQIVNAFTRATQRDPALAQETLGLRNMLLQAANDNAGQVTRSAASPGNDEENRQNEGR